MILGRIEPGEWLGLAEAISEGPYLIDAITEEKSEVMYIYKNNFKKLLEIPAFKEMILKYIARNFYSIHSNLETHTPMQKIVDFFTAKISSFGKRDKKSNNYIIDMTQEALAESIGFTRETVNKHLHFLQKRGIITISRGQIEITNYAELKKLIL